LSQEDEKGTNKGYVLYDYDFISALDYSFSIDCVFFVFEK